MGRRMLLQPRFTTFVTRMDASVTQRIASSRESIARWRVAAGICRLSGGFAFACGLVCLLPYDLSAAPVVIITEQEAQLEASHLRGHDDLSDGPEIRVQSPAANQVNRPPIAIDVSFAPGVSGEAPDFTSLKVTYLRAWGIDLTRRFREHLKDGRLYVPEASVPTGKHSVEIYIEDRAENPSSRVVTITVGELVEED